MADETAGREGAPLSWPPAPTPKAVAQRIRAAGGMVTFARFMELALTHPTDGYYTRARSPLAPPAISSPCPSGLCTSTGCWGACWPNCWEPPRPCRRRTGWRAFSRWEPERDRWLPVCSTSSRTSPRPEVSSATAGGAGIVPARGAAYQAGAGSIPGLAGGVAGGGVATSGAIPGAGG